MPYSFLDLMREDKTEGMNACVFLCGEDEMDREHHRSNLDPKRRYVALLLCSLPANQFIHLEFTPRSEVTKTDGQGAKKSP